MGNSDSDANVRSIVSVWGNRDRDSDLQDERIDTIEFISNRKIVLTSIGICRTLSGSAKVIMYLIDKKAEKLLCQEIFKITKNYLEENCLRTLKKPIELAPARPYQIKLQYFGDASYTYQEIFTEIKEEAEDFVMQIRRIDGESLFRDGKYIVYQKLITDLGFDIIEKAKGGCF